MGLRPTEGNESRQAVVGRGFMPRRPVSGLLRDGAA